MPNYSTMSADDDNFMVINDVRYPIINSGVESEDADPYGRKRWFIVTEGQQEA